MFCSNCGNYCANMKFCPMCGTKVLEVEEAKKEQEDSYEIPYRSTYVSPASVHLDITKSFLAITKKVFFRKIVTKIPYEKLKRVKYCRNELLRDSIVFYWNDTDASGCIKENTVTLNVGGSLRGCLEYPAFPEKFQIFYMCKVLAAHAELEISFAEQNDLLLERFSYIENLDDYYSRFSPLFNQAVTAIMREHGLSERDASYLIDTLFMKHLQELYQSDPLLAVRDYHRIRGEINRVYEERRRKDIEDAQSRRRH